MDGIKKYAYWMEHYLYFGTTVKVDFICIIFFTRKTEKNKRWKINKAGYMATLVACGWTGAVLEKIARASGQELYAQKAQKLLKSK